MEYPSAKSDSLELYVRKAVPLSRTARHLYAALRWLEAARSGLCRPVFAGYRDLANEAAIDIKSVKPALKVLQLAGLCEVTIGCPIKAMKKATTIRRKTLDEIKIRFTQGDDEAHRLAMALSKTHFSLSGKVVKPSWTVGHTGRVCSSKPNFQGIAPHIRMVGLADGLKQGECLVYADIKQAEPTVIKHLLNIPLDRDLYREYMDAVGCSRPKAKEPVNILAYCTNTLACFKHWPKPARDSLAHYVHPLAEYKEKLFKESQRTRSVTTIKGRYIVAEKGRRLHRGTAMNWRVQGTIADIINGACLCLLDFSRVALPEHDGVYVILPGEKVEFVEAMLIEKAREIGLAIQVKVEVRRAR